MSPELLVAGVADLEALVRWVTPEPPPALRPSRRRRSFQSQIEPPGGESDSAYDDGHDDEHRVAGMSATPERRLSLP